MSPRGDGIELAHTLRVGPASEQDRAGRRQVASDERRIVLLDRNLRALRCGAAADEQIVKLAAGFGIARRRYVRGLVDTDVGCRRRRRRGEMQSQRCYSPRDSLRLVRLMHPIKTRLSVHAANREIETIRLRGPRASAGGAYSVWGEWGNSPRVRN